MLDITYGLKEDRDILGEIFKLSDHYRKALGLKTVSGFTRGAVRQDIYDEMFLETKPDPWSTVLMNERERYAGTHLWRSRASEFMINEVYNKTGYTFSEFLKLPTYMVEHILSTLRQMNKDTRKSAKDIEKELEDQSKQFLNLKGQR